MKFSTLMTIVRMKIDNFFFPHGKCKLCSKALHTNWCSSKKFRETICNSCFFAERKRIRANNKRKRNKRNRNLGRIYFSDWHNVLEKHDFSCCMCKAKGRKNITLDHIVSLKNGGTNTMDNIQPLCASCHEKKDGHKPTISSIKHRYAKKFRKFLWDKFKISSQESKKWIS